MIEVKAELVGNVWKIITKPGDAVIEDQPLLILESMKMEIEVWRPELESWRKSRSKKRITSSRARCLSSWSRFPFWWEALLHGCYTAEAVAHHRAQFEFGFGSGPGIRTLNLAVNRSLRPVQKQRLEFAACR